MRWLAESKARPLIKMVYHDARELAQLELEWLYQRCQDLTDEQREVISQFAERLTGKFLHPCVSTLRQHGDARPSEDLAAAFHDAAARLRDSA